MLGCCSRPTRPTVSGYFLSLTDTGGRLLLRKPSYLCTRREPCARVRRIRKMGAQIRDAERAQPQKPADGRVSAQRGRDTHASAGSRGTPRHPTPGNRQMGTHPRQADTTQPQQPADTRTSQRHRRNSRPSAGSCAAKKTGTSRYLAIFERQRPGTSHLRPDGNPRPTTPPQS